MLTLGRASGVRRQDLGGVGSDTGRANGQGQRGMTKAVEPARASLPPKRLASGEDRRVWVHLARAGAVDPSGHVRQASTRVTTACGGVACKGVAGGGGRT